MKKGTEMTDQELADKIVKELTDAGLTPDEMLEVIRLAREEYERMKLNEKQGGVNDIKNS